MSLEARFTADPAEALLVLREFLAETPIRRERLAGLLHGSARRARPGRHWWVERGGEVLAAASEGSPGVAEVAISDAAAVNSLANALAGSSPSLCSIRGATEDAERVGAALATRSGRRAVARDLRCGMEVNSVVTPVSPAGSRRLAEPGDVELLIRWMSRFDSETGTTPDETFNRTVVEAYVGRERLHVWESDGGLVASTAVYDVVPEIGRLVFVYTPFEQRGNGYAGRLVAEVAGVVIGHGSRCILYADTDNRTACGVYERVGFRPFADLVTISLEP